jgi:protein ImuB
MLGYDAVVTAVAQGGRTPAEQVRWVPWGEPREERLASDAAWPGALPAPFPARVFDPPIVAELVDVRGEPITVTGRGEQPRPPARLRSDLVTGMITAWAGPWPYDVRWWDARARRRCVRWQVVVDERVACIVVVENGRAGIEAIYD